MTISILTDFSESEIENFELLDNFIEHNILSKEDSSSSAKTALDSVFDEFVGKKIKR